MIQSKQSFDLTCSINIDKHIQPSMLLVLISSCQPWTPTNHPRGCLPVSNNTCCPAGPGFLFTFSSVLFTSLPRTYTAVVHHTYLGRSTSLFPPMPPTQNQTKPPPGMKFRAEHEMNGTKPRWGQLDMPPMCMPSTKSHFSGTLQWQLRVILPVILPIHHIHHMLVCSPLLFSASSANSRIQLKCPIQISLFPIKKKGTEASRQFL